MKKNNKVTKPKKHDQHLVLVTEIQLAIKNIMGTDFKIPLHAGDLIKELASEVLHKNNPWERVYENE